MGVSNDRSQIVIICDTVPYPARSGDNQRIAELIDVLREHGWYVHLLLCGFINSGLRKLCLRHVDALHVYNGIGWQTRLRNIVRRGVRFADRAGAIVGIPPLEELFRLLAGRAVGPLIVDYWQRYPAGLDEYVGYLSTRYPWKAAIVEYIWLHRALDKLANGTARLLDTHDIQHKRVEEFASRGMVFPLAITRDEERRIFDRFDAVIAIQAAEADLIKKLCPQLKVLTVGSSGLSVAPVPPRPAQGRILYVGGYNGVNIDGLCRFFDCVWPKVLVQVPSAELHVCGHIYRAFLGKRFPNVTFLGHKETVESEYAHASVVINPVWIGTGLKIKTVEALARGKPLVTTSKGIEGLPQSVLASAAVVENSHDFATQLTRFLTDPKARQAVSRAAAEFADIHLNKRAVYRELFEFLENVR
jgi:succinoglycan biosynthesis protein ExoO